MGRIRPLAVYGNGAQVGAHLGRSATHERPFALMVRKPIEELHAFLKEMPAESQFRKGAEKPLGLTLYVLGTKLAPHLSGPVGVDRFKQLLNGEVLAGYQMPHQNAQGQQASDDRNHCTVICLELPWPVELDPLHKLDPEGPSVWQLGCLRSTQPTTPPPS